MKSRVNTEKSSVRAKLLNLILDAFAHLGRDKPSLKRSVTSVSRKFTMCIDNQEGPFKRLLLAINISNHFIKFHDFFEEFHKRKVNIIKLMTYKLLTESLS
jgi:hypothetical protein